MKAYGIPRRSDVEFPDKADAEEFGMKSRVQQQRAKNKKKVRRSWKKKERARVRSELKKTLEE